MVQTFFLSTMLLCEKLCHFLNINAERTWIHWIFSFFMLVFSLILIHIFLHFGFLHLNCACTYLYRFAFISVVLSAHISYRHDIYIVYITYTMYLYSIWCIICIYVYHDLHLARVSLYWAMGRTISWTVESGVDLHVFESGPESSALISANLTSSSALHTTQLDNISTFCWFVLETGCHIYICVHIMRM